MKLLMNDIYQLVRPQQGPAKGEEQTSYNAGTKGRLIQVMSTHSAVCVCVGGRIRMQISTCLSQSKSQVMTCELWKSSFLK